MCGVRPHGFSISDALHHVIFSPPASVRKVDVPDFLSILDLVKPVQGEIFVDLGSGVSILNFELVLEQDALDAAACPTSHPKPQLPARGYSDPGPFSLFFYCFGGT